jgi:hypothetical protein
MGQRSSDYRSLAAECRRLASTTGSWASQAEYTALAKMWSDLAEEADAESKQPEQKKKK